MIVIDAEQFRAAVRNLSAYIDSSEVVFDAIGNNLKLYVQETIERGGRDEPWAPLSVWSHMRTGRTKPLETLAQRITYQSDKGSATVFFLSPSPFWNITQHHTGYITPERWGNPVMVVPMSGGDKVFFRHAKQSVIPARPVWPTEAQAEGIVMGMVSDWLNKGVVEKWR